MFPWILSKDYWRNYRKWSFQFFSEWARYPGSPSQLFPSLCNADCYFTPIRTCCGFGIKCLPNYTKPQALGIPVLHRPKCLWETFQEAHSSGFPIDCSKKISLFMRTSTSRSKSYFTKSPDSFAALRLPKGQKFYWGISSLSRVIPGDNLPDYPLLLHFWTRFLFGNSDFLQKFQKKCHSLSFK